MQVIDPFFFGIFETYLQTVDFDIEGSKEEFISGYPLFLSIGFIFYSSFKFTAQLSREFPYTPNPHLNSCQLSLPSVYPMRVVLL